jgi:hypothetical protein
LAVDLHNTTPGISSLSPADFFLGRRVDAVCQTFIQMGVEGVNYWDTYAPIVQWSTVSLALILSTLSNLHTRQVDYDQAYTQADLDCDLYMQIPAGFIVRNGKLEFVEGLPTKDHCICYTPMRSLQYQPMTVS